MPDLSHSARSALAACALVFLGACASTPTAPKTLDALRAQARGAKTPLSVCPGAPAATAKALEGLTLGASLMDAAWDLADASHDTQPVEALGDLFPGVKADAKQRVLTVTPVRVKLGAPLTLLYAITTDQDVELEEFKGVDSLNALLLGCTQDGAAPGYRVLRPLDSGNNGTVQPQGSDVVVLPNGDVVTTVRMMYALPEIMEYSVFTANIAPGSGDTPAVKVESLEVLAAQFNSESPDPMRLGEIARSEARAGSGWYPLDGAGDRWVYVLWAGYQHPDTDLIDDAGGPDAFFNKEPRPDVPYAEFTAPQLSGSLSRAPDGAITVDRQGPDGAWVWLGNKATACPASLRCGRFDDVSTGLWKWRAEHPYAWTAGVWTTPEGALKALRAAGVDLSQGALMSATPLYDEAPKTIGGVPVQTSLPY